MGAREGATFVAEKLVFKEIAPQGGAVDGHEEMSAPWAAGVQRACDQLFAAATFPQQEHVSLVARDLVDGRIDFRHGGGGAHHAKMFKRGRHRIVRLILVERFVDQFAQSRCNHFHLKGRTKVVGCPKLHNVHRILQGRGGAKNHDWNFRIFLCSTREDRCQGRCAWPLEHDHGNKRSPIERRQGFAFAGSHLDLETARDEIARQRRSDRQADDKTGFPFTPSAQLGHSRSMPNRHACCNSIYARCFL